MERTPTPHFYVPDRHCPLGVDGALLGALIPLTTGVRGFAQAPEGKQPQTNSSLSKAETPGR